MVKVEVCVESRAPEAMRLSLQAAEAGGATTVELCREMPTGGLTPEDTQVTAARRALSRARLQVMIRPRAGNFCYAAGELEAMLAGIAMAARAGADGVVFGALTGSALDLNAMTALVAAAKARGLTTTCHRAFDALNDRAKALEALIELGVDRVLTSGTPWEGGGSALEGAQVLSETVRQAAERIEVVLGGGVHPKNVLALLRQLPLERGALTVHAYSGVHIGGVVDAATVAQLARLAHAKET